MSYSKGMIDGLRVKSANKLGKSPDTTSNSKEQVTSFERINSKQVTSEDVKKWAESIETELLGKKITWKDHLDLWKSELESTSFFNITIGANGGLKELQKQCWLRGLHSKGFVAFECLRILGGKLVEINDEIGENESENGKPIITDENLLDELKMVGEIDAELEGMLRSHPSGLLDEIRGCNAADLRKRHKEEEMLGFIVAFFRGQQYTDKMVRQLAVNLVSNAESQLKSAGFRRRSSISSTTDAQVDQAPLDQHSLMELKSGCQGKTTAQLRRLLDRTVDQYQRNQAVFKSTLVSQLNNGNSAATGAVIVALDTSPEAETQSNRYSELDNFFRKNKNSMELSHNHRKHLVHQEVEWYNAHIKSVREFTEVDIVPPPPKLMLSDESKLIPVIGTINDNMTEKLRQYCEKKSSLEALRDQASLVSCLLSAERHGNHGENDGFPSNRDRKVVLVLGYCVENGELKVDNSCNAPVVVRQVPVKTQSANKEDDYMTEIGARLDGYYAPIPNNLCTKVTEQIVNSALRISSKQDTLVYYEFIPSNSHFADSVPLETVLNASNIQCAETFQPGHMEATSKDGDPSTIDTERKSREGKKPSDVTQSNSGQQTEVESAVVFTHILFELPPRESDIHKHDKVSKVYANLRESCGQRFLASLQSSGEVDMEGMRLPSVSVVARSSVAPYQNNLSFRRYLLLLPASLFGFDPSATLLKGLLQQGSGKGFVESAETLAEVLSLMTQYYREQDSGPAAAKAKLCECLEANPLILYCMSTKSLRKVHAEIFPDAILRVWKSILNSNSNQLTSKDELAAKESLLHMITGNSHNDDPAPAALFSQGMLDELPALLKKAKFNSSRIEIEPSNYQSIMIRLEKRAETSILVFYLVELNGNVTTSMLDNLLDVAKNSASIKLVFRYSKSLMGLLGRISANVRSCMYINPLVDQMAPQGLDNAECEESTVLGSISNATHNWFSKVYGKIKEADAGDAGDADDNDDSDESEISRLVCNISAHISKVRQEWIEEVRSWMTSYLETAVGIHEPVEVLQNTRVLVMEDPNIAEVEIRQHIECTDKADLKVINAREKGCFNELATYLYWDQVSIAGSSLNAVGETNKHRVVILVNAQLLQRDRLQVIAQRCTDNRTPLLLATNLATRQVSDLRVVGKQGGTSYVRIPIIHHSPGYNLQNSERFSHISCGLKILFGPHYEACEDVAQLEEILMKQDSESVVPQPSRLTDFPLSKKPGPEIFSSMMKILASDLDEEDAEEWSKAVTKEWPSDRKPYLGSVVAAVIRLYINKCKGEEPDICFSDVAKHPLLVCSQQTTRLELFLLCMMKKLELTLKPWWLPISENFNFGHSDFSTLNIRNISHPGHILCAHIQENSTETVCRYLNPGKPDSMTSLADIIEQASLRGADLDWNTIHKTWSRTPDVATPLLLHLLRESPFRVLLALSLNKNRLATLPMDDTIVSRLSFELQQLDPILQISRENGTCSDLDHRVAVLAWSLVKLSKFGTDSNVGLGNRVNQFLGSKLKFDLRDDANNKDLIKGLIRHMLQLDHPIDAFVHQREFGMQMISKEWRNYMKEVLTEGEEITIGASFVAFCLSSDIRTHLLKNKTTTQLSNRLLPYITWADGTENLNSLEVLRNGDRWKSYFSSNAMAEVLLAGTAKYGENDEEMLNGFIESHLLELVDGNSNLLGDILCAMFLKTEVGKLAGALRVCAVLRNEEDSFTEALQVLQDTPGSLKISKILATSLLPNGSLELDEILDIYEKTHTPLPPLTCSGVLVKAYINKIRNVENVEEELKYHNLFFDTRGKRETLLKAILREVIDPNATPLFRLAWYAWSSCPSRNLPEVLYPAKDTWDDFATMTEQYLKQNCKDCKSSLSSLAKYAVMPHCLPNSTLASIQRRIYGDDEALDHEETLVLAQKGSACYPVYLLKVPCNHPVPLECILLAVEKLNSSKNGFPVPATWNEDHKFPMVQQGFSTSILAHNIRLLLHLSDIFVSPDTSFSNCTLTGITLLTWFKACGIPPELLASTILKSTKPRDSLKTFLSEFVGRMEKGAAIEESLVYCPLPNVVETYFNEESESNEKLFLPTSKDYTAYRVENLANFYSPENATQIRQLVEEQGEAINILRQLFVFVGTNLSQCTAEGKRFNVKPACQFILELYPNPLDGAMNAIFDGITEGLRNGGCDFVAEIADEFFVCLGLTPLTDGKPILDMIINFTKLPETSKIVSTQMCKEVKYMSGVFSKGSHLCQNSKAMFKIMQDEIRFVENRKVNNRHRSVARIGAANEKSAAIEIKEYAKKLQELLGNEQSDLQLPPVLLQQMEQQTATAYHFTVHGLVAVQQDNKVSALAPHTNTQQQLPDGGPGTLFTESSGATRSNKPVVDSRENRGSLNDCASDKIDTTIVSARSLLRIRNQTSFGVVEVAPGLHPVLRKPSSSNINEKFARHTTQFNGNSFDENQGQIAHVFATNGETWEYFQKLPLDSTIYGKDFYLRKTRRGTLAMLLASTKDSEQNKPQYFLCNLVDTHRLAGLQLDKRVVYVLEYLVLLAFLDSRRNGYFKGQDVAIPLTKPLTHIVRDILKRLRRWSCNLPYSSKLNKANQDSEEVEENETKDEDSDCLNSESEVEKDCTGGLEDCSSQGITGNLFSEEDKGTSQKKKLEDKSQQNLNLYAQYLTSESKILEQMDKMVTGIRDAAGNFGIVKKKYAEHFGSFGKEVGSNTLQDEFISMISIIMSTTVPCERSQLVFALDLVFHNHSLRFNKATNGNISERLIAAHAHITQAKFRKRGFALMQKLSVDPKLDYTREFTKEFEDSDDEDEVSATRRKVASTTTKMKSNRLSDENNNELVEQTSKQKHLQGHLYHDSQVQLHNNDETDESAGSSTLFPYEHVNGYGRQQFSTSEVWTLHNERSPLYFVALNTRELKLEYSDADGLPIAYVFHKRLVAESLRLARERAEKSAKEISSSVDDTNSGMKTQAYVNQTLEKHKTNLLDWLAKLTRSPLPVDVKLFMMESLRHGAVSCIAPHLTRSHLTRQGDNAQGDDEEINLLVIANCVAAAIPKEEQIYNLITKVYSVPPYIEPLFKRKNDLYGVHIVTRQLREEVESYGIKPVLCELGHDSLISALDDTSMYLKIIGCFTEFTWLVWVTGLPTISDQLLKWIAEYTKHHPWRFVYLENCDTSWNYSENRDRCVLVNAPPNIGQLLQCKDDLNNPRLSFRREVHENDIANQVGLRPVGESTTWPILEESLYSFFEKETCELDSLNLLTSTTQPEGDSNDISMLEDSDDDSSDTEADDSQTNPSAIKENPWKKRLQESGTETDYRVNVQKVMHHKDSCVVLLISPPGAGKSYFSDMLKEHLNKTLALGSAYVDGSDDELVDTALNTVLERKVPVASGKMFVVIDEFHMLSSNHKKELFRWIGKHAHRLHVLLIANRKDASDDTLIESLRTCKQLRTDRVVSIDARLPKVLVEEVIQKSNLEAKKRDIILWFHLTRSLFGGEAISLRSLKDLHDALCGHHGSRDASLCDLLQHKLPRLSRVTCEDFISAFNVAIDSFADSTEICGKTVTKAIDNIRENCSSPTATMIQAALLTVQNDAGIDFPDFIERVLGGASGISPAYKIAAWCCMMRAARDNNVEQVEMIKPVELVQATFIDQIGFPHQLTDRAHFNESRKGLTFSWNGSYESLVDMTDALRRGHSINFQDVHDKEWKENDVVSLEDLVVLVSACRSPAVILNALRPDNLTTLLQSELSDNALRLAVFVLENKVRLTEADADGPMSPYRASVWTVITCTMEPIDLRGLSKLVAKQDLVDALVWARTNCAGLTETRAKDLDGRTRTLRVLLTGISKYCRKPTRKDRLESKIPLLWRGIFASLLDHSLHPDIVESIAKCEKDAQAGWHPSIHRAWRIANGNATQNDLSELWENGKQLLLEDDSSSNSPPIRSVYVKSLFQLNNSLPLEVQEYMLTTTTEIPEDVIQKIKQDGLELRDLLKKQFEDMILLSAREQTTPKLLILPQAVRSIVETLIKENRGAA